MVEDILLIGSILVAIATIAYAIYFIIDTRRRFYEEYMSRREGRRE
jgi:hypothetical protein